MVKIEITLRFLGTGINNYYQVNVRIYDSNNNLVYCGKSYNGVVNLYLKKNCVYLIKARLLNTELITTFIVLNNKEIIFNMCNKVSNNNPITFLLTDYNYRNLPIMKGVIILGKNN